MTAIMDKYYIWSRVFYHHINIASPHTSKEIGKSVDTTAGTNRHLSNSNKFTTCCHSLTITCILSPRWQLQPRMLSCSGDFCCLFGWINDVLLKYLFVLTNDGTDLPVYFSVCTNLWKTQLKNANVEPKISFFAVCIRCCCYCCCCWCTNISHNISNHIVSYHIFIDRWMDGISTIRYNVNFFSSSSSSEKIAHIFFLFAQRLLK